MMTRFLAAASLLIVSTGAMAGGPITLPAPAPILGAFGPIGLAAAGIGYVAYKLYQHRK